jgi:hypothetical protein
MALRAALIYSLNFIMSLTPRVWKWQARDPLPNAERLQGPNLYSYVKNRDLNLRDPFGLEGAEGFGIPENPAPQSPWDPRVSDQGRQNYSCALQKQQQHVGEYFSGVSALGLGVIALNVAPTALGYALTNPEGALNWLYFSGSAFALTPPGPYENIGDALGDTAHHLWDWLNDQEKGRNESNRNCANKCNN